MSETDVRDVCYFARKIGSWFPLFLAVLASPGISQQEEEKSCLDCHGNRSAIVKALEARGRKPVEDWIAKLVVQPDPEGSVHHGKVDCATCHPDAETYPHPREMSMAETCIDCHEEALEAVNESAHHDPEGEGNTKAACWDCHGGHDIRRASDARSKLHPQHVADTCLNCHDKREYLHGVHGLGVLKSGLDVAATCISCHGGHDIQSAERSGSRTARRNISATCGRCHIHVMETYIESVHGASLRKEDNPDVPTCVDCHEAHATADPFRPHFRIQSPQTCAHCHADEKMMAKYGISTAVFQTYVADFHGTTAELFEAVTPFMPLNQAVCYDCHGFHNVESVRKIGEAGVKERMLKRCQACHPDANLNFATAWLGHYIPSPDRFALIYYVDLFYRLIIPGTIGFFLLYIAADVIGRIRRRREKVG